jgi:hypothetical protein
MVEKFRRDKKGINNNILKLRDDRKRPPINTVLAFLIAAFSVFLAFPYLNSFCWPGLEISDDLRASESFPKFDLFILTSK